MRSRHDERDYAPNMAIFADYENIAIGCRDARYDRFDIHLVLERLLDKGKIVVKKAYADWGRYREARRPLHEASFELIEIPHVSISGKNSADIRLVVDALDLCYTKAHVDLFVIVSGDSDFSPLVSKLRENDKRVIGVGVKNSTSDLLIDNCDEFIFYDDLVRDLRKEKKKQQRAQQQKQGEAGGKTDRAEKGDDAKPGEGGRERGETTGKGRKGSRRHTSPDSAEEERKVEALEMVLDQVDALFRERDDSVWGSMVKQTLKRKRPHFSETFHGYRNFSELIEDAGRRGMLEIQRDERSGGYLIVAFGKNA